MNKLNLGFMEDIIKLNCSDKLKRIANHVKCGEKKLVL